MKKTPERRQWRLFGGFIVDFEPTHVFLVLLLLTLSKCLFAGETTLQSKFFKDDTTL